MTAQTTLGQLCATLWNYQSRPDVIQPGFENRDCSDTSCTELQCLRPLHPCVCVNYLTALECLKGCKNVKYLLSVLVFGFFCKENIGNRYRPKMSYRCITISNCSVIAKVYTADELSNKAQEGVVYGQYTTAKGCSYVQRNAECLDTALAI